MEMQIRIVKKIAPSLDQGLQDMQSRTLSLLEGKLKTASLTMDQLMHENSEVHKHDGSDIGTLIKGLKGMNVSRKVKYVTKRTALTQIVVDIEKWQARYDPSWILITQMSIGNIDEVFHQPQTGVKQNEIPIITAAKGLRDVTRDSQESDTHYQSPIWIDGDTFNLEPCPIPYSSVQVSLPEGSKEGVIIDTMITNRGASLNKTTRDVRNLARNLAEVEPTIFGLLKCKGVIKLPRPLKLGSSPMSDFKFVFDFPRDLFDPQSLRGLLLAERSYPLDERIELAKRLVSSVLFVHTIRFVHKNIRPETIIVFGNDNAKIGAPFLAGFEQFRLESGITYRLGDGKWEHNLCMYGHNILQDQTR